MLRRLFFSLPLSFFLFAFPTPASAKNVFGGQWPLLPKGVAAQEGEVWGELPNGFRYVLVPTDAPAEAVSLRLLVGAGAAQAPKGKAGTSYLLTELVAAGTKNFSRDRLVQFQLSNGMNPHSGGFSEVDAARTVYRLDLEEPADGALATAVELLADVAGSPVFDPDVFAVARSSLVERAGSSDSTFEPKQAVLDRVLLRSGPYADLRGSLVKAQAPGVELEDVRSYWSKWYKSDRMVLVVAGVIDSSKLQALVEASFSSLEASSELIPIEAAEGKLRSSGDVDTSDSKDLAARLWITNVSKIGSLFDEEAEKTYYKMDFVGRVAQSYAAKSTRFPDSVLERYGDLLALSIGGRSTVANMLPDLIEADRAVHRLAEFGIRLEDLDRAKSDYLDLRLTHDLDLSVRQWPSVVADRAVRNVVQQIPFRYGSALNSYLEKVISPLAFEQVRALCAEVFREKSLSYYLEPPMGFGLNAKIVNKRLKAVRKGYDFTWEQAGKVDLKWNFGAGFRDSGMVKSTEIIRFEEYPVLQYAFSNNLRMNFIRTDAFAGQVHVNVSMGNGTVNLLNQGRAFEALARNLMLKSKAGKGAEAPLFRDILKAKGMESVDAGVTLDHLYWSGVGSDQTDIEGFLLTVALWMVNSDIDEETFDTELKEMRERTAKASDLSGYVKFDELSYAKDARLRRYFKSEDLDGLDFKGMRDWLSNVRLASYIEITVAGDVEPRTLLRDVRNSFGAAPVRTGKVFQPRHGERANWGEAGVVRERFKMPPPSGYVAFVFPQVVEKSCSGDRVGSLLAPLLEEHLKRSLASQPAIVERLSLELVGEQMVPLSNAVKVQAYVPEELSAEAEKTILSAVDSFASSLTPESVLAAERKAILDLKRIARSPTELIALFKQAQGKPRTLGCVQDLLKDGFGMSFEQYQEIAARQFSGENARGVVLLPAE